MLTHDDVIAVLGPAGDDLAAEIIATGATRTELAEAWAWLHMEEALVTEGHPPPTGKVAELVELLVAGPEEQEP